MGFMIRVDLWRFMTTEIMKMQTYGWIKIYENFLMNLSIMIDEDSVLRRRKFIKFKI